MCVCVPKALGDDLGASPTSGAVSGLSAISGAFPSPCFVLSELSLGLCFPSDWFLVEDL